MEGRTVDYIVHESITARMERTIKRLWVVCLVLIGLLTASSLRSSARAGKRCACK